MSARFQGTCGGMRVSLCSIVWNGCLRTYSSVPAQAWTDFLHTAVFSARTYPAHIPKTLNTWAPTLHILSWLAAHTPKTLHILPATLRKHVNFPARTYSRGSRTYLPVWRLLFGPLCVRPYVRTCARTLGCSSSNRSDLSVGPG